MFIDFHKYNYELVPADKRAAYLERDQQSYRVILRRWLEDNLEEIVVRRWEICDIHYLTNVSDFIKLIREAEQLYEFGFFTGCIALVGVASEDFLKYLSIELGKPQYEHLSQYERLKKLEDDNLIAATTYTLLDSIRKIRNECLHYNQNFKQKTKQELKNDALVALNNLKETLKVILSAKVSDNETEFVTLITAIGAGEDIRNNDEIAAKVKNAVSHLLHFPVAFDPESKVEVKTSMFIVKDIDDDEITLEDLNAKMIVYVEYTSDDRANYEDLKLQKGNTVVATISSVIDVHGLTSEWKLIDINPLSDL